MAVVSLENLIQAGVHFGHRVSRWHPKMAPYIFDRRNLIHIVDIRETIKGIIRASNFLSKLAAEGKDVVFVGTKRQAKSVVQKEAERCNMHYVSERWLGGTLTNYHTIRERLKRLEELEELERTGEIDDYSKKRVSSLRRERKKIQRNLEGIRNMKRLPGCLVLVDIRRENIALREAKKVGIPVVAVVDTDCDPTEVDIVIPGNDDAFRSIQEIVRVLADHVVMGSDKYAAVQAERKKARLEEEARAEAERAQAAARVKAAAEKAAAEKAAASKAAAASKKPEGKKPEGKKEPQAEGAAEASASGQPAAAAAAPAADRSGTARSPKPKTPPTATAVRPKASEAGA